MKSRGFDAVNLGVVGILPNENKLSLTSPRIIWDSVTAPLSNDGFFTVYYYNLS